MPDHRKIIIIIAWTLGPLLAMARQQDGNAFSAFASQQEKVFVELYEKRM